MTTLAVPKTFIWRRIHSLMGLWFVLFLIEHLLTNSQAALWLGDDGKEFVAMVNGLHNLPYLQVIELTLIGVPILIHAVLGVRYLFTAKFNFAKTGGASPSIRLGRNRAYTWQRITSWILLFGLLFHVTKFRFIEYPHHVQVGSSSFYLVTVKLDEGLYRVADRLNVALFDEKKITEERKVLDERGSEQALIEAAKAISAQRYDEWGPTAERYEEQKAIIMTSAQRYEEHVHWVESLERESLKENEVIAAARDFGTATLLSVRDTFKSPIYIGIYTIFVLAACFHAFNGFWTFLITWGWVLKKAAQRAWVTVSVVMMLIMTFLGLAAIWGTYWLNLRI